LFNTAQINITKPIGFFIQMSRLINRLINNDLIFDYMGILVRAM